MNTLTILIPAAKQSGQPSRSAGQRSHLTAGKKQPGASGDTARCSRTIPKIHDDTALERLRNILSPK